MSDSVRSHRRQSTRLLRPWDSPGKITGVGCHFLLQCMKVKSEREVAQSCLILSMNYSLPGSSIHGIFQASLELIKYLLTEVVYLESRILHIAGLQQDSSQEYWRNGNPLQYCHLENFLDRGAWWATVHGNAESDITERLNNTNTCQVLSFAPMLLRLSLISCLQIKTIPCLICPTSLTHC